MITNMKYKRDREMAEIAKRATLDAARNDIRQAKDLLIQALIRLQIVAKANSSNAELNEIFNHLEVMANNINDALDYLDYC